MAIGVTKPPVGGVRVVRCLLYAEIQFVSPPGMTGINGKY
jgi:hypothetical protein